MFAGFMEGFGLKKKGIAIGMLLLFTCLLLAGCGAASTEKKAVAGSDGIKIDFSSSPEVKYQEIDMSKYKDYIYESYNLNEENKN